MPKYSFAYLDRTGMTKKEILTHARKHKRVMEEKFPGLRFTIQEGINSIIDAVAERNQGG